MREEGIVVTVPMGAQQALIFLAPQTGGDFATLRSAVQGKPGAFVRAAQDLQLASLNRARLEKYLTAIRESDEYDPKALHERALILARSLSIKVDEQCFTRPALQQASCLMQNSDQLVLDDGHGESMVSTLTQGAGSDLIGAISTTKVAGRRSLQSLCRCGGRSRKADGKPAHRKVSVHLSASPAPGR